MADHVLHRTRWPGAGRACGLPELGVGRTVSADEGRIHRPSAASVAREPANGAIECCAAIAALLLQPVRLRLSDICRQTWSRERIGCTGMTRFRFCLRDGATCTAQDWLKAMVDAFPEDK